MPTASFKTKTVPKNTNHKVNKNLYQKEISLFSSQIRAQENNY